MLLLRIRTRWLCSFSPVALSTGSTLLHRCEQDAAADLLLPRWLRCGQKHGECYADCASKSFTGLWPLA